MLDTLADDEGAEQRYLLLEPEIEALICRLCRAYLLGIAGFAHNRGRSRPLSTSSRIIWWLRVGWC